MDRRRWMWVGGGLVLVLIVAGGICVKVAGREQLGQVPAWLRSHQPPEGLVEPVEPVEAKAAWASCRPSPMVASCTGMGAGRRVRKTYASNLSDEPSSLISGHIAFGVGC